MKLPPPNYEIPPNTLASAPTRSQQTRPRARGEGLRARLGPRRWQIQQACRQQTGSCQRALQAPVLAGPSAVTLIIPEREPQPGLGTK